VSDLLNRKSHQPVPLINPQRWPDIASPPPTGVKATIARVLFRRVVRKLPLRVEFPDGEVLGRGGPLMRILRPTAFYRRVGAGGLIGFGEAYMAGDWAAEELTRVLTVFASQVSKLVPPALQRLRAAAVRRQPRTERGTPENARTNISRHYDLSNELFATFLDETMTYSSADFESIGGQPIASWDLLAMAQRRKIDRLLDGAGVTAGSRVLEIGTGWGELAIRAAGRGAYVHSITLSAEQRELAMQRVAAAGLSDRVTIELLDYREVTGKYDAVVSVEMIEAVGYSYWSEYFSVLTRVLNPGGSIGLQAITMPHDRMLATRNTYTWIHKYIFPGGLLPSVRSIGENACEHGLRVTDDHAFGPHYAETLRLWRERFDARADDVLDLGFDEMFRTMWRLYLAYSEAGFTSGYLDVHQFVLVKDPSTTDEAA
jgi:cyclopropane-fatty-acyl-phospholipid synthase